MTPSRLDDALLEDLLGPGPAYRDIISFVRDHEGDEERFAGDAEQAIDSLDFEADVTSEDPDALISVKLDPKTQQKAVDLIQAFAKATCENRVALGENAVDSLLKDMSARLGNLPQVLAAQAAELEIADAWYGLAEDMGAIGQFVDHCRRQHDVAWIEWFLSGVGGHRTHDAWSSSLALQHLGIQLRCGLECGDAAGHVRAWCRWHLRHDQKQSNPHLHAIHLASQLADPHQQMAQALDEAGFRFDIERIDWSTLVRQAAALKANAKISPQHVEVFLDKHLETLAGLAAHLVGQVTMDDGRTSYASHVSLTTKPMTLAHLVGLVAAPEARRALRSRLEAARMEHQTAPAAGRTPKGRL